MRLPERFWPELPGSGVLVCSAYLSAFDEVTPANQSSAALQRPPLPPAQQGPFSSNGRVWVGGARMGGLKTQKTRCSVIIEGRPVRAPPSQASAPTQSEGGAHPRVALPLFQEMDSFGDAICSSITPPPPPPLPPGFRFDPPPGAARPERTERHRPCWY